MGKGIVWLVLILLHLICCILVWLGIRSGLLKVKRTILPVVVFVPLWGLLCVLVLHFQFCFGAENVKKAGLEKMKINDEIYKSIFVEDTSADRRIVPLEEALLINDPGQRRELIMNVLNEDSPDEYLDLLQQARMNEDAEVVHYATTAMAELAKQSDLRLQKLEAAYQKNQEDEKILEEYCSFLGNYISQELIQGQMLQMQRMQYVRLLRKLAEKNEQMELYQKLAETQLVLEEYGGAEETIYKMEQRWPGSEEVWMLKVRFWAQQKQGERLHDTIRQIKDRKIYLSAEGKERIAFWESGQA